MLDERKFVGLAPQQTESFLATYAQPVLERYAADLGIAATTNV